MPKKSHENKVYRIVQKIPKGKVTTYKLLSELTKIHPRHVGSILHQNPNPLSTPCHRVIKSDGSLASGYAFGGSSTQKKLLEKESIVFNRKRINLQKYLYKPKNT